MNEKPHIIKERASGRTNWCVHYAGFHNKTHCKTGVEYTVVEKAVEHTYGYKGDKHIYTGKTAHPCFKEEGHLTDGCAQCRFRTLEEIAAEEVEFKKMIDGVGIAHTAIVAELERRHKIGDQTVNMNGKSSSEYDDEEHGHKNYVSGAGTMTCPVCSTGKLGYSRAAYNGHVHAKCSTLNCVAWME